MTVTSADLIAAFGDVADAMETHRDALCALDGEIGDGDHGIAMALGFSAAQRALEDLADDAKPSDVFNTAARSFLNAVGASCGPLYATALMRAGAAFKTQDSLSDEDASKMIAAMAEGIAHRGKASLGDKTMLDVWQPAADAAASARARSFGGILQAAASAADRAANATANMPAKLGRAARLGSRSVGHVDPGAASAALVLRALASGIPDR